MTITHRHRLQMKDAFFHKGGPDLPLITSVGFLTGSVGDILRKGTLVEAGIDLKGVTWWPCNPYLCVDNILLMSDCCGQRVRPKL